MVMTPEKFASIMAALARKDKLTTQEFYNTEDMHEDMDRLMCQVLRALGYGDGVTIFEETPKWYA